jgi:drug/metabolite transporter (DMT)-like permease
VTAGAPVATPAERRRTVLGAGLMVLATFGFVGLDSILKVLATRHEVLFLSCGRNLVQVGLLALLMPWLGARRMITTRHPLMQLARGALLVATTVFIVLALSAMPLAQTYAVTFSAPALAALLAMLWLGERPSLWRWLWIGAGFCGVMVALRPDAPGAGLALLYPLAMAAANAVYHVTTRAIAPDEDPLAMLFLVALAGFGLTALALPWTWSPLDGRDLMLLLVGGVFGTLAQLLLVLAFRLAPTAIVSPMIYSQIVAAMLVGYVAFGEVPAPSTLLGAAIVVLSGVALVRTRG